MRSCSNSGSLHRAAAVTLVLANLLPGCSHHPHTSTGDGDTPGPGASARFIHLAPGLSRIDIYLESGETPIETLDFTEAGRYREIPAGPVGLDIVERRPDGSPPLHRIDLEVPGDAIGTIAIHEAPDGLRALFLSEPTEPLDSRIVPFPPPRFEVTHTAPALGALDVYMPEEQIYLDGGGGQPGDPMERVWEGLAPGRTTSFFGHYTTSPIVLDAGQDASPDYLFDLSAASLTDITTFFVTSDVNDAVFLAVLDAEGTVSIVDAQAP